MTQGLRPIFALFTRAVRDDVRSKFPPVLRAVAVVFVLLLIWGNQQSFQFTAPGQSLLMKVAVLNLVCAAIMGIGTFSSAITEEKEDETMGLLMMTRLNPLAILLGKSTARLAGGLLFVVVQIPFTILCVTLGGVTIEQVLNVYAILGAFLVFLCNLGLLFSVLCRRTSLAVILTLVAILLLYLLPMLLARSAFHGPGSGTGGFESFVLYLFGTNPIMDTASVIYRSTGVPFSAFSTHSISFNLYAAGSCFLLAWLLFNRCCSGDRETVAGPKAVTATGHQFVGGVAIRGRFSRAWPRAVAWKDFHFLIGGAQGLVIRVLCYSLLILLFLGWVSSFGRMTQATVGFVLMWSGLIIFLAEMGSLGARIFGRERRQQTLGSLVTLPLPASRLIWQKVTGCLPVMIPSLVIWLLGMLIYWDWAGRQRSSWVREQTTIITTMQFLALTEGILLGILVSYLSLRMRRLPLLAGIGILFIGNFLMMFFIAQSRSGDGAVGGLIFFIFLYVSLSIVLAMAIPRRVEACAAEE